MNRNFINLTKNEKKVLLMISKDYNKTDSEIAKKIGIAVSSVSRIKNKLIKNQVLNGAIPKIDYSKLGINCYVLVLYSATPLWWEKVNDKVIKIINNCPQIVSCIRTNEKNLSYIVIYAFPNSIIANEYLNNIQKTYNNYLIIEKSIFLSKENFLKNDPTGLMDILDRKEVVPDKEFFNKLLKE